MAGFDIFGMCNALTDVLAHVDDATVAALGYPKGSMNLVTREVQQRAIEQVRGSIAAVAAGGSGANTMIGATQLGAVTCFTSRVGRDELGEQYAASLESQCVAAKLGAGDGMTGSALVLITPDAERTMLVCLGEAQHLEPSDVDLAALRDSEYLYVTGYLWDTPTQQEAVLHAMREAGRAGVKVALSLSDPFCVDRHRSDFLHLATDFVDVLFANDTEALRLTGAATPQDAAQALADRVELAVVTLGAKGSLLCARDEQIEVPARKVEAVDTTGAGDIYAAGILYGLTHGLPLDATGRLAAWCAGELVAQLGPRLSRLDVAAARAWAR